MPDELDFSGKTVLVTGSGRNIGRAIILEFAARGANVVINARTNDAEARAVEQEAIALGASTLVVMGDVSELETVTRMQAEVADRFGRVDICVSNAAIRLYKDFFDTTNDDWHRCLNQQLTASWYLAKAFTPAMVDAGWGRLIHINGPDGFHGSAMHIPHATSKGGLRTLTKSLAAGLGIYGITVNDVIPGFVETMRDPVTHPRHTPEYTQRRASEVPIGRQPKTAELAWVCAFLASARSDAITGAAIPVDGGLYLVP